MCDKSVLYSYLTIEYIVYLDITRLMAQVSQVIPAAWLLTKT